MADNTRTIEFSGGNLPGNPHSHGANEFSESGEILALTHEQRTANLIALLNTPDVPASHREVLMATAYKHLGIKVSEPNDGGTALNL